MKKQIEFNLAWATQLSGVKCTPLGECHFVAMIEQDDNEDLKVVVEQIEYMSNGESQTVQQWEGIIPVVIQAGG